MSTSLGSTFKATRSRMVEMESESLSAEFSRRFSLSEGSYLQVKRANGGAWQPCRILAVQQCYLNDGGGYTGRCHGTLPRKPVSWQAVAFRIRVPERQPPGRADFPIG